MIALLIIVAIAAVCLMFAQADRRRPVSLALIGVLCLVLGGRAAALWSDSVSQQFALVSTAAAQEPVDVDPPASSTDVPAASLDETSAGSLDSKSPGTTSSETPVEGDVEADVQAEVSSDDEMLDSIDDAPRAAPDLDEDESGVSVQELSIDPVAQVKFLTERPDWVESKPQLDGEVHQLAVASGYEVRESSADEALLRELKTSMGRYINDEMGSEYAATLIDHEVVQSGDGDQRKYRMRVGDEFFTIGQQPFEELIEFDFAIMNQSHLLVKIEPDLRESLDDRWREVRATYRLLQTGLGAGLVLLLLGTVFSYFKLDTATRGYYTGRLQFGAAAAILTLIVVCVLLAKWIPWM